MSIYQQYLEHQKQANLVGAASGMAGGASLPFAAGDLVHMLGKGITALGKGVGKIGTPRAGGLREAASTRLNDAGAKVEHAGSQLSDMTRDMLNYGKGMEYNAKALPGGVFDHNLNSAGKTDATHTGINKLTPQRALNWAGNAAMAGGMVHGAASMIAPTPPNAIKTAHVDFANLVAYMENNS